MFINHGGSRRYLRRAYTLIELLVVITTISILAGIVLTMWPGLRGSQRTTNAADKIQTALLIAKQMALRNGQPYGVRLINDPNKPNNVVGLVYISQPDPFTTSGVSLQAGIFDASHTLATFSSNVDFSGGLVKTNPNTLLPDYSDCPVQPGDYLEINGGGSVRPIANLNPDPSPATAISKLSLKVVDPFKIDVPTTQWRIIRQPRVVAGEEGIDWSQGIIIDVNPDLAIQVSRNIPQRPNPYGGAPYYEILFSPSGRVIGQGVSSNDKILLYIRDGSLASVTAGEPLIVGVQIGSGFIGGYPVDKSAGGDPYSNTHDARAGGM